MNIKDYIEHPRFFSFLIKQESFFNSLKNKFPEILADLVSSRDNPNCSCKNRVKAFLLSKIESENTFFEKLFSKENIEKIIEEKDSEIGNGKIFEIGKGEDHWISLCSRLKLINFKFRSFSVVEKEDKLIVYFF